MSDTTSRAARTASAIAVVFTVAFVVVVISNNLLTSYCDPGFEQRFGPWAHAIWISAIGVLVCLVAALRTRVRTDQRRFFLGVGAFGAVFLLALFTFWPLLFSWNCD